MLLGRHLWGLGTKMAQYWQAGDPLGFVYMLVVVRSYFQSQQNLNPIPTAGRPVRCGA
jgi:hypothetical protein